MDIAFDNNMRDVPDAQAIIAALGSHGHRLFEGADRPAPSPANACRYLLDHGEHELLMVAMPEGGSAALYLQLLRPGSDDGIEHYRELGVLCRPATEWGTLARREIAEGPEFLRFRWALDEFALTRLGCARFLADFHWAPSLRTREESFGGLVFVPETSLLLELDAERFEATMRAVTGGQPSILAKLVREPELTALVGGLVQIAGIRRRIAPGASSREGS